MKTQSQGSGHPAPSPHSRPEALDEKITHITEEVARTANKYKVPILIGLVGIVAIVAIASLVSFLAAQQEESWSERIHLLFRKTPAEIRGEAPSLADELRGTRIEPAFVARYSRWLFEENAVGDRERAFSLVEEAKGRHPGDLLLDLVHGELEQVRNDSEGFVLPPIPEPAPPTTGVAPAPGIAPPGVAPPGTVPPPTPAGTTGAAEAPGTAPAGTPPAGTPPTPAPADATPAPPVSDDPLGDDPLGGDGIDPDGGGAPPRPAPGDGGR